MADKDQDRRDAAIIRPERQGEAAPPMYIQPDPAPAGTGLGGGGKAGSGLIKPRRAAQRPSPARDE